MSTRAGAAVLVLAGGVLAMVTAGSYRPAPRVPFGFSTASAPAHLRLERDFMRQPDPDRLRAHHRHLTAVPHPAGSARNRELADWTAGELRAAGFDVELTRHDVLLPYPLAVHVQLVAPESFRAAGREAGVEQDRDTRAAADAALPGFHAYAASGRVTADVVYAGEGQPSDYDWLAARGVEVHGRLVLVRHSSPYSYRGFKVWTAERRGAAGLLIFSDPGHTGEARYPEGAGAPADAVERGSVAYGFLVPGDPLTPGWASTADAPRVHPSRAPALPAIPSVPLSAADAAPILRALGGARAPDSWQGGMGFDYHVGPGPAVVRLHVEHDDEIRSVWTVTGLLPGRLHPEELVIAGNHRDAWVYGGVDPSSGTAALVELARALGALARGGWRPKRSILLASWDAEEFSLVSSTEWAEQHQEWLRDTAVAYVNVDSAASGPRLAATAVPSLARLIEEVAQVVRDPATRVPLAALAFDARGGRGDGPGGVNDGVADTRVGGGSDYTVFLNHLGIPAADLGFRGPHGVYHSLYDTHEWVSRFGDPGFRYHAALVQFWGLMLLRLADADVLPFDPAATARYVDGHLARLGGMHARDREALLGAARAGGTELMDRAAGFAALRDGALRDTDGRTLARVNQQLLRFERAFVDPEGLAGRSWYRHLLHAPAFTYQAHALPGVADALDSGDPGRIQDEVARLTAALRRASAQLADGAIP